jgi:hypothetical protein
MALNNKTSIPLGRMTIKAGQNLPANRFVNAEGNLCASADNVVGVTTKSCKAGELASICFSGIVSVEVGGVINTIGSVVGSDSSGRAIISSTAPQRMLALDKASASGQFIRVRL